MMSHLFHKYMRVSVGIACLVVFFSLAPVASAQFSGGGSAAGKDYFGGQVTQVTYCPCVYYPGVVITITDYSNNRQTLKLFYSLWLSRLWANYNIWAGEDQYVLGGYIPHAGVCLEQNGYYCKSKSDANPDGMIDMIRGIGSSM